MQLFGFTITRQKQAGPLAPVDGRGGWWPVVREPYAGAWQQNAEIRPSDLLAHPTVFGIVTKAAADIAKCPPLLKERDDDGIWSEIESPSFSPVLRKPNRYQTRIAFYKSWMLSLLIDGNTYVLKQRDLRRIVTALYVLDPTRVVPLVASDGGVYYELTRDPLSSQSEPKVVVPASEIIHDLMYPLYHPLRGVSPLLAAALPAILGNQIQKNQSLFFRNQSRPSGMLTAPGALDDRTVERLKADFETKFGGENIYKVLVGENGLKFDPFTMTALDSQLTEQWKAAAEAICQAFGCPRFKVGVGPDPSFNNGEMVDRQYYSEFLQEKIESIELLLDEGLGLGPQFGNRYGVEFDLSYLLRMDTATLSNTLAVQVGAGLATPNEGRKQLNLPPVEGGDTPYLQQQYWPLSQLPRRESPAIPPPAPEESDDAVPEDELETRAGRLLRQALEAAA